MESIMRRIMSLRKNNRENNIAIKREINQWGGKIIPITKINTVEKNIMERKKMQELQNKIIGQGNNIGLTKGTVHDIRKRQFIKKGILGIIAGIGIAIFSKIARADGGFINYQGGKTAFEAPAAGIITMPSQSCVLAQNSTRDNAVTGAGTVVTVEFDNEIFDQNGDFNSSTDTFTAPVTGRYLIVSKAHMRDLTTAMTSAGLSIVASNRTAYTNENVGETDASGILCSIIIDMDAADTVTITLNVNNGVGDDCDIGGSTDTRTYFSALLVA